jgi:hypothetical protein
LAEELFLFILTFLVASCDPPSSGPGIVTWSSGKQCNGETHYGHFNCKRVRRDGSCQQDILEDIHIQYENTPATWLAITVVPRSDE